MLFNIFSTTKPFHGYIEVIQQNALLRKLRDWDDGFSQEIPDDSAGDGSCLACAGAISFSGFAFPLKLRKDLATRFRELGPSHFAKETPPSRIESSCGDAGVTSNSSGSPLDARI